MSEGKRRATRGSLDCARSSHARQAVQYEAQDRLVYKGMPDFSPFCTRVEAYLRYLHQPYVKRKHFNYPQILVIRFPLPMYLVKWLMIDHASWRQFNANSENQPMMRIPS